MKLRLAALRINSIDIKMTMMFRRVKTPATPMMKSSAPITRNFERSGLAAACLICANRSSWTCCSRNANVKLSILFRPRLQLREFWISCDLFPQGLRIDVVGRSFLSKSSGQHHRSDDRNRSEEHTSELQ